MTSISTLMIAAEAFRPPSCVDHCPIRLNIDREPKPKRTIINKKGRKSKKKRGW